MAVLLNNNGADNNVWRSALSEKLGDMPIFVYPNIGDVEAIHYAVVWHHPIDDLFNYPNLKAILVLGAGMEDFDQASALPNVPIVRLVDPAVGSDMAQYVLYWVMHFQRGYEKYRDQQVKRIWQRSEYPMSSQYRVTILGAGQIATFIAEYLQQNGFNVAVWNRSERTQKASHASYYFGDEGLKTALKSSDVLVNVLPHKPATTGFVNESLLSMLPRGAHFINVSRGSVVDELALHSALERGELAGAVIDTVRKEPLDKSNALWSTPNLHITPHMSGATFTRTAAGVIADNILRMERGEAPFPIYKPSL